MCKIFLLIDLSELAPHFLNEMYVIVEKTERLSEFIYFVVVKLTTVCGMAPRVIVSLYFYYTKDLGRESFELPLSMWYGI